MHTFALRNSVLRSSSVIPLASNGGFASVCRIVGDTVFLFKGCQKPLLTNISWFSLASRKRVLLSSSNFLPLSQDFSTFSSNFAAEMEVELFSALLVEEPLMISSTSVLFLHLHLQCSYLEILFAYIIFCRIFAKPCKREGCP